MKTVTIYIRGGLIDEVEKPNNVNVLIRDYDVDFIDDEQILKDETGAEYILRYPE